MTWHTDATIERFWNKVDRSGGADDCWPWTASVNGHGYGRFKAHGVAQNASRVCMEIVTGSPVLRQQVNHRCNNRRCCNPGHLYVGDQSANMRDMWASKVRRTSANIVG